MRFVVFLLFYLAAMPVAYARGDSGDGGWGGFGGGDTGSDGFGAEGGSRGDSGNSGGPLLSDEYIRALGEVRTENGLLLLIDFIKKDRRALSVQRDLGTLCAVNNCRGLGEEIAIKILNNAMEDADIIQSRADRNLVMYQSGVTIVVAIIALIASLLSLILSNKEFFHHLYLKAIGRSRNPITDGEQSASTED